MVNLKNLVKKKHLRLYITIAMSWALSNQISWAQSEPSTEASVPAASADPQQQIAAWIQEVVPNKTRHILHSYRIALFKEPKKGSYFPKPLPVLNQKSILRFTGAEQLEYFQRWHGSDLDPNKKENFIPLLRLSNSGVLHYCKGKKCALVGEFNGKPVIMAAAKKLKKSKSEKKWFNYWRKQFGYDGVVIDTRGEFILVGMLLGYSLPTGVQGFTYAQSNAMQVVQKKLPIEGMYEAVATQGPFLAFKRKMGSLAAVGAKLLIDPKSAKKK